MVRMRWCFPICKNDGSAGWIWLGLGWYDLFMKLSNMIIETERLKLVPITMGHKEEIFREFQEPVTKYMYPKAPEKIEETEEFIKEAIVKLGNGEDLQMVVLLKDTDEFLGCAGLHHIDKPDPEFGIWLKKSAHRNKYGQEAMRALKNWADENLDYKYIKYPVVDENVSSRKVAEFLGGEVAREYDEKMMSGRTYRVLEYRMKKPD